MGDLRPSSAKRRSFVVLDFLLLPVVDALGEVLLLDACCDIALEKVSIG